MLAWYVQNTISYYTYDPNNKDAVGGFVGAGISQDEPMENIYITAKAKPQEQDTKSSSYSFPWATAGGTLLSAGSHLSHNKVGWYSLSQLKFYSPRFYGNQYTAGGQKAAKALGVKLTRLGYVLGAWNMYDINRQYQNNEIGTGQMVAEQGVNTISTFGGIYGAAVGVSWELGRGVTSIPWYRANIRPLIQDGLGIPRDEYRKTPYLDKIANE